MLIEENGTVTLELFAYNHFKRFRAVHTLKIRSKNVVCIKMEHEEKAVFPPW